MFNVQNLLLQSSENVSVYVGNHDTSTATGGLNNVWFKPKNANLIYIVLLGGGGNGGNGHSTAGGVGGGGGGGGSGAMILGLIPAVLIPDSLIISVPGTGTGSKDSVIFFNSANSTATGTINRFLSAGGGGNGGNGAVGAGGTAGIAGASAATGLAGVPLGIFKQQVGLAGSSGILAGSPTPIDPLVPLSWGSGGAGGAGVTAGGAVGGAISVSGIFTASIPGGAAGGGLGNNGYSIPHLFRFTGGSGAGAPATGGANIGGPGGNGALGSGGGGGGPGMTTGGTGGLGGGGLCIIIAT